MKRAAWILAVFVLTTISARGYTTASITGAATRDGVPLAGVTVTVTSPAMQGARSTVTDVNGRYAFIAVPPGDYEVEFSLAGMQTVRTKLRAGLGQTGRADAAMVESASPEPAAAAPVPAAVETKGVQTNAPTTLVDVLPVGRDPVSVVGLAPGTQGMAISGANANASMWFVDGAVSINPGGGAPVSNYVEDAIQETTLLSAAIPAEYGRFSGGVVNTITLSGGNDFSGSFRDSFTNPSWTAASPYQNIENSDHLEQTFEAATGGRAVRDRLWFFVAGRMFDDSIQQFYARSPSWGYARTNEDRRLQLKLTGLVTARHSVAGSYVTIPVTQENVCFGSCAEPSSVDPDRATDRDLAAAYYTGMLTDRLSAEAFWGASGMKIEGGGGDTTDQALGSWGYDMTTGAFYGAPVFCGVCENPEERSVDDWGLKMTYYLATATLGTHVVAAGYDHWSSDVVSNNFQSASGFAILTFSKQAYDLHPGDTFRPTIAPGDLIGWFPIAVLDHPSSQDSHAFYVSDRWDLGAHWSFTVGARYDLNDVVDESGYTVSDTGTVQPRVAAVWDLRGDGRYRVNASYAHYADRIGNTTGSLAWPGGSPMALYYEYAGPRIAGRPTFEAFKIAFDWFNAQCDAAGGCGVDNRDLLLVAGGGASGVTFGGSLESPLVKEAGLGFSFVAGSNLYVRIDGIRRDFSRFLVQRVTPETGQTKDPFGNPIDVALVENDDAGLSRRYDALMLQGSFRLGDRWSFGGNYTWSKLRANAGFNQVGAQGPAWYPELTAFPRSRPVFDDRRHKLRAFAVFDWPTKAGRFDFSVLESLDSGAPYSVEGGISTAFDSDARAVYSTEPLAATYFFSERGAYHWDTATSTDVGVRYQFPISRAEVFVDVAVANVFDESAQTGGNTYVSTRFDPACRQTADPTKRCALFNPFTDTPVEGVHYVKSPTFGQATSTAHYQTPRTYSFSAGLRF